MPSKTHWNNSHLMKIHSKKRNSIKSHSILSTLSKTETIQISSLTWQPRMSFSILPPLKLFLWKIQIWVGTRKTSYDNLKIFICVGGDTHKKLTQKVLTTLVIRHQSQIMTIRSFKEWLFFIEIYIKTSYKHYSANGAVSQDESWLLSLAFSS